MHWPWLLVFLFSATISGFAQNRKNDSLEQLVRSSVDSVKANAELALCEESEDKSLAKALGISSLKYFKKTKQQRKMALLYKHIGNAYYDLTSFDTARFYYDSSLTAAIIAKDSTLMSGVIVNIGNIYGIKGDYEKCLHYFLQSLKIDEKRGNKTGAAKTLGNIGELHSLMGNLDEALNNHKKSLALFLELNSESQLSRCYNNIGLTYTLQKKYDAAEKNLMTALEMAERENSIPDMANATGNLTKLFLERRQYPRALKYGEQEYKHCETAGNIYGQVISANTLALIHSKLKNFDQVHHYTQTASKLAEQIDSKYLISELYRTLGFAAAEEGDYKTAFNYMSRLMSFNDSLQNEDSNKQMAEMQTKYETEKKENSIRLLNAQNELKETALEKEKLFNYFIGGFAVLIAVIAFVLFRNNQARKRANALLMKLNREVVEQRDEVRHQKHIIEEKQKEILDSIYYARRIQRALITSEKNLERWLNKLKKGK